MDQPFVYLDHNATTPVAPEVTEAMLPYFRQYWGNPSSAYSFGHHLSGVIEEARTEVAQLINADPAELVFTSCGTEGINTAIQSALASQPGKNHIVTTLVEHSATLKCCEALQSRGVKVTWVGVDGDGRLDMESLQSAIQPETALVSVMWANNETGILFPVPEVGALCRERGVLFHTDAVQMAGKLPMDVIAANVDMLSLSAHKLNAPKGIGALFIRRKLRFCPHVIGGSQERGRRGGTENVPYIAGFGTAARLARNQQQESARLRALRDRMEAELLRVIPQAQRNGAAEPRLPNTSNLSFDGVDAEGVLMLLDQEGICASSGSACTTGSLQPSHVLTAMGRTAAQARGSLRFSLGRSTTDAEVDRLLNTLPGIIAKLRFHLPSYVTG